MSFNPNIPQPTDDLSDSQGDLLQNNLALDASFSRNHLPFSDLTASNGKHTFMEMVNRGSIPAPAPGLAAGSGTIYTKSVGTPSESQIFYTPDASGSEFQLTTAKSASISQFGVMAAYGGAPVAPITLRNGGWTFLPGGLILQYGLYKNTLFRGTGSLAITVPLPITFPNACFTVNVSWNLSATPGDNSTLGVSGFTKSDFDVRSHSSSSITEGIYWWAIGN